MFKEQDIRAREMTARAQPNTALGKRSAMEATAMRNANAAEKRQNQPAPAPPPPDPTPQNSATRAVQAQLDAYGLGSLAPSVWQQWLDGVPVEQIVAGLRDTAEYKARFPGLDKMRKENRGITEQDWVNYERSASAVMRQNGIPASFYDSPADFARLIDRGVDPQELEGRIQSAQAVVVGLPQSVRDAATAEGINLGDLTAMWLDPDVAVPAIERKVAQLTIQGAAADAGWGGVGAGQANALASQGVNYATARTGFSQAVGLQPLAVQQLGDTTSLSRDDLAAATVGGNADAKRRVQKRADSRAAQNVQGGGYAGSGSGVGGLGSASR